MKVDIAADMEGDKMANMKVDMVADMKVDKVADMKADMAADMEVDKVDIVVDMKVRIKVLPMNGKHLLLNCAFTIFSERHTNGKLIH